MRPALRRRQHIASLLGCGSHASLRQHVFALLQRRQGKRAVHIGPGPDADGVDRIIFQQFLPVVVNAGNVELLSHTMARLEAAIGHPNDLHPFDLAKARNVAVADIATCTYKTYTNFFFNHAKPPSRSSAYDSPRAPSTAPCDLVIRPRMGMTSVPREEGHKKGGVEKAVPQWH